MSAGNAAARPPAASMPLTRSSNRSARRATAATTAPSRASSSAVAAPMPEEAPVTTATRSFTSNSPAGGNTSGSTRQTVRLLEDAAQCIQPVRPDDAVDHAMIAGQRHVERCNGTRLSGSYDYARPSGADRQNGAMRRIDDGGEALDAEHPEIRDAEGSSHIFIGLQALRTGAYPEVAHLR